MGELVTGFNNFYASIVRAKVLHKESEKVDDEEGETA
jgi:hypothetical protein